MARPMSIDRPTPAELGSESLHTPRVAFSDGASASLARTVSSYIGERAEKGLMTHSCWQGPAHGGGTAALDRDLPPALAPGRQGLTRRVLVTVARAALAQPPHNCPVDHGQPPR
jgi:hypothetical protein